MNERIQKLAEQAWDETKEEFGSFVDDSGEIDFTFLHAYTEKFAELIVLEVWQYRRISSVMVIMPGICTNLRKNISELDYEPTYPKIIP